MRHLDIQIVVAHLHKNKISICTDSENVPLAFFPPLVHQRTLFTNSELRKHKIIICKRMFTQRNSLRNVTWRTQLRFLANLFRGEPSKWEKRYCSLKTSGVTLTQSVGDSNVRELTIGHHGSLHGNRYNHLKMSPTHNAIKPRNSLHSS